MKKLGRLLSIPETYTFGSRTLIVQLKENKKCAYALVIGRCSPDLDSKLQGSAAFVQAKAKADQDIVQLLLVIREHCCRFDDHQQSTYALKQAKHQVSTYYQAHDVTNTEYYVEHFKALVGVVEIYGGAYGREPRLVATELVAQGVRPEDVDLADRAAIIKAEEVCRECYLSCMLLRGADNGRYFQLKVDLSNDMTKGAGNYPKTIVETMCLLGLGRQAVREDDAGVDDVDFAQISPEVNRLVVPPDDGHGGEEADQDRGHGRRGCHGMGCCCRRVLLLESSRLFLIVACMHACSSVVLLFVVPERICVTKLARA